MLLHAKKMQFLFLFSVGYLRNIVKHRPVWVILAGIFGGCKIFNFCIALTQNQNNLKPRANGRPAKFSEFFKNLLHFSLISHNPHKSHFVFTFYKKKTL